LVLPPHDASFFFGGDAPNRRQGRWGSMSSACSRGRRRRIHNPRSPATTCRSPRGVNEGDPALPPAPVGLIVKPEQAEEIVAAGEADMVSMVALASSTIRLGLHCCHRTIGADCGAYSILSIARDGSRSCGRRRSKVDMMPNTVMRGLTSASTFFDNISSCKKGWVCGSSPAYVTLVDGKLSLSSACFAAACHAGWNGIFQGRLEPAPRPPR